MVLGADEDISERTNEDFKDSGLAHVLAVSGQNVTLLAVLAWPLLAALGLGRRARLAGVLALIALYVPLTGAGPSIMRAGVMGAAGTVAALAGRPASRWYALLLAAAITLALDPRAWQDVGWQLSFAAVVGIFLLVRPLMRALARLPEPLAAGTALTVAATVATAPLMAFHFGRVSLVSLLANLAALPAVAPVMWIGMLAAAAAQVSLVPAALLNALDGYLLGYVSSIARWSAGLPGAVWKLRIGSALGARGRVRRCSARAPRALAARRRRPRPARRSLALLLAAGAAALARDEIPPAAVALHGHLPRRRPGRRDALPGAGRERAGRRRAARGGRRREAARHGVRALDVVVLTHAQRDHQGGLEAVVGALPVRLLLDGGARSADARARPHRLAGARPRGPRGDGRARARRSRLGRAAARVCSARRRRSAHDPGRGPEPARGRAHRVLSAASTFLLPPTPRATSPRRCRCRRWRC